MREGNCYTNLLHLFKNFENNFVMISNDSKDKICFIFKIYSLLQNKLELICQIA